MIKRWKASSTRIFLCQPVVDIVFEAKKYFVSMSIVFEVPQTRHEVHRPRRNVLNFGVWEYSHAIDQRVNHGTRIPLYNHHENYMHCTFSSISRLFRQRIREYFCVKHKNLICPLGCKFQNGLWDRGKIKWAAFRNHGLALPCPKWHHPTIESLYWAIKNHHQ
jgi:hypothetical protein